LGGARAELLLSLIRDGVPGGLDTGIDIQTRYQTIQQASSICRGEAKDFGLEDF
jgi:hypothetical protein